MSTLSTLHSLHFNPVTLSKSGEDIAVAGSQPIFEALSDELSVLSVDTFHLSARIVRWQKHGLKTSGTIKVDLCQECISTLESVSEQLDIHFERRFIKADAIVRKYERIEEGDLVIDPDGDDEPDEMPEAGIDLWETVLEEINLAMNPFPRSPVADEAEATETAPTPENDGDDGVYRPFADLNALINEKNSKN